MPNKLKNSSGNQWRFILAVVTVVYLIFVAYVVIKLLIGYNWCGTTVTNQSLGASVLVMQLPLLADGMLYYKSKKPVKLWHILLTIVFIIVGLLGVAGGKIQISGPLLGCDTFWPGI